MDILHIDDSIIVLNKPAGLPVLPDGWEKGSPYLVHILEEQYGKNSTGPGKGIWVVHRLDKVTSGVMVFARTADAHRALSIQFERHEARKIYHAILTGLPAWEEKTAKHPLRVNIGHKHRTAVDLQAGKPSETRFKVLERYANDSLMEAQILTGRTHQIRAHAYALGHPLLGDALYSAPETDVIPRPALHAYTLRILNPETGAPAAFTAPYPEDFSKALQALRA